MTLADIIRVLRRQRWWLAAITVSVVVVTLFVTLLQDPIYQAQTTLRIEEQPSGASNSMLAVLSALNRGAEVETEMEIIQSRRVAEGVVSDAGLQITLRNPDRTPRVELFEQLEVSADAKDAEYTVDRQPDGYVVRESEREARGRYGKPVVLGSVLIEPRAIDEESDARKITFETTISVQ